MLTLAIDTSGLAGSVAVARRGELLAERQLDLRVHHGQSLVPEVHRLLGELALPPKAIELVSIVVGPGSFTGLRVGVVFAKTFAWATGCRITAVETFEAIAAGVSESVPRDLVLFADAQRGELLTQTYGRLDASWSPQGPITVMKAVDWAQSLPPQALVGGPGLVKLRSLVPSTAVVLSDRSLHPRAAIVAELGLKKAAQGVFADTWGLEPLYLRRTSAEVQWEALGRK
jgi:tRNA threonylcarbamoyladenosine biosynthesis protein TsaB